ARYRPHDGRRLDSLSGARLDLATGRERVPSFFAAELIAAVRRAQEDLHPALQEAKAQATSKIGWSAPDDPYACIDDSEYVWVAKRSSADPMQRAEVAFRRYAPAIAMMQGLLQSATNGPAAW